MTITTNGFDPLADAPPPATAERMDGGSANPAPGDSPSPENRALLALKSMADQSGLVAGTRDSISEKVARIGGFEKTYQADQAVKNLVSSGQVKFVQGKGLNIVSVGSPARRDDTEKPEPKPKKATERKPRKLPRTGLETRAPEDQNEHLWAAINSNRLSGSSQLVTMTANALLGAVSRGRKFGEVEREITADYMAAKTGLSTRTARTALADAVKAGFLVRLDQGKGGVAGRGKARYRAVLPVYGGTSDD